MVELLLVLYIILQGLDMYTTMVALKQGGSEANPILAYLFKYSPPLLVMVVVKACGVAALVWANSFYVNIIGCAIYAWVVINNWKVIRD
jgi:hypothetical protein